MTDLDQLLRDTLHGRAATVTEAPPVAVAPARADRSRWLLVAATVATVLAAGAGVAVWGLGRGDNREHAGGGYAGACDTRLPAAWRAAVAATPLTVDGVNAYVEAGRADGSTVLATYGTGAIALYLRKPSGATSTLIRVSRARVFDTPDWDGTYLVISSAPALPKDSPDRPVDDIAVVDTRSGHVLHVAGQAPVPAGWVVAGKRAVIQDGVVYWAVQPSRHDQRRGLVLSYTIRSRIYDVVARTATFADVERDSRGVFWPGGSRPARHVPPGLPGYFDDDGEMHTLLVSDGQNYAWNRSDGDRLVVRWEDAHGAGRTFDVNPVDDARFPPLLTAVLGPLVFMELDGYGGKHFVLDTRTGALASTGSAEYRSFSPTSLVAQVPGTPRAIDRSYPVDTGALPELHCR